MKAIATWLILIHSWYPRECCEDEHCHPVPCEQITTAPNGDLVFNGMHFSGTMIRNTQDGKCHVCSAADRPYCVFIQNNS